MPRPISAPAPDVDTVPEHVQARLNAAGLRRTLATRAVIGVFLARPAQGLSHAQVLQALRQRGLAPNRVTLYRLLDRLAACDVLARHSDERGTWRFRLQEAGDGRLAPQAPALVPRFECRRCGQDRQLGELSSAGLAWLRELRRSLVRQGQAIERMELAFYGVCADCADRETAG